MALPKVTNQGVAVLAITLAVGTIFGAFWLSRADHDLKLMSLQAVLTTGGTLLGIAGTLLVGVDAYKRLTSDDLPPGSSVHTNETSDVRIPPTTPLASNTTTATETNIPKV